MKQLIKAIKADKKWVLKSPDWKVPLDNFSWTSKAKAYLGCKCLYPDGKRVYGGYEIKIQ